VFAPKNSTASAATTLKEFIELELGRGRVTILASLDVNGALEMAWCPAILKGLRDTKCSRNLYQLTLNDFRGRRAVLSNKSCKIEMNFTNRFQKVLSCGTRLLENTTQLNSKLEIH